MESRGEDERRKESKSKSEIERLTNARTTGGGGDGGKARRLNLGI